MIAIRPKTIDKAVRHMVMVRNEYRLPEKLQPDSLVLDIGAHIGSFTQAALDRGAGHVCAVEADLGNYCIAQANLYRHRDAGRVRLFHKAVWRSDANEDVLHPGEYPQMVGLGANTGGATVLWAKEGSVLPKIGFDELVAEVTENGRKRINLMKIDCEGSEWPILLTSKSLHLIDEICGEFHEIGGDYDDLTPPFAIDGYNKFTTDELTTFLEAEGFQVEIVRSENRHGPLRLGLFFAKRYGSKRSELET
ncbi:MAG: FkbM family methyltransferase [Chloroflexota bacterium]